MGGNEKSEAEEDKRRRNQLARLEFDYRALHHLLTSKIEQGLSNWDEYQSITGSLEDILGRAGQKKVDHSPVAIGLLRHAVHLIRQKTLELHPEWRQELDAAMLPPRSR